MGYTHTFVKEPTSSVNYYIVHVHINQLYIIIVFSAIIYDIIFVSYINHFSVYSLDFITGLLQNAGTHIDPTKLIKVCISLSYNNSMYMYLK